MTDLTDDVFNFVFTGDDPTPLFRLKTGLYSLDHAFETAKGEYGMPIGTGYEIFGAKSTGKSTFCYSLMAITAKALEHNMVNADLEGFDPGHLKNILQFHKYRGEIRLVHQGTDEEILGKFEDCFLGRLKDGNKSVDTVYGVGLLDSIAAISPAAERDGDLGGANMGRRAFLMAQMSRRLLPTTHPRKPGGSKNVYFMTNHWYEQLGTRGYQSPGGSVKDYLFGVQIHLKRRYISYKGQQLRSYPDGSYILDGTIYKNRYGLDRKEFQVFIKGGYGIHKGITAILDGADAGVVDKGSVVKVGDESFGYFSKIVQEKWDDEDFFDPFYAALETVSKDDAGEDQE